MSGINEDGRSSTILPENATMIHVIACLRRICVCCDDILVPDTRSDTRSVSLLVLENIVLPILLIPLRRARATAFVDVFVKFMDQVHGFRKFGPSLEPYVVRTRLAEIRIVVNQIFNTPHATVPMIACESLAHLLLAILNSNIQNKLFDS